MSTVRGAAWPGGQCRRTMPAPRTESYCSVRAVSVSYTNSIRTALTAGTISTAPAAASTSPGLRVTTPASRGQRRPSPMSPIFRPGQKSRRWAMAAVAGTSVSAAASATSSATGTALPVVWKILNCAAESIASPAMSVPAEAPMAGAVARRASAAAASGSPPAWRNSRKRLRYSRE